MSYSEIKIKAKEKFKKKWGSATLIGVMLILISCMAQSLFKYETYYRPNVLNDLYFILIILVLAPLYYGITNYFMDVIRDKNVSLSKVLLGFKDFSKVVEVRLVQVIYIFLWSLLFIVPGIIKFYSYSMVFYILNDSPNMSAKEALNISKNMMFGNRIKLFTLHMSIIGWVIIFLLISPFILLISVLALNSIMLVISMIMLVVAVTSCIVLIPYLYIVQCYFYEDIKKDYLYKREV